ncbi:MULTISPECIES: IS110 family transposase [unclassified Paraflavitalea]|jgi:transposase|uniref:IS110 family transposase n=1 Tax=unclassified Paraflavitalea TaxID=2798305 RepID=UPI003D338368
MKKIIKQVVAIDVAQEELVVCLGRLNEDLSKELFAHKTFGNNKKGFTELVKWVTKSMIKEVAVQYVMEATGVYHEALAFFLDGHKKALSIVLPNKISNYARTLDIKTVTDKTSSEAIALFSLERQLEKWVRPAAIYLQMRQLTRERSQLLDERTVLKNQLHAEQSSGWPNKESIARTNKRIALLTKQDKEITESLQKLIKEDPELASIIKLICSIPGISTITAATIIAETNCFALIKNKRQLTSYAGLDIREKQSGTSVKGKPRISKRGNKKLRSALYMPALTAIRHDERYKAVYARLVGKHGVKMKAAVAIQRKLLEMSYTVFKTGTAYDKDYYKKLGGNP